MTRNGLVWLVNERDDAMGKRLTKAEKEATSKAGVPTSGLNELEGRGVEDVGLMLEGDTITRTVTADENGHASVTLTGTMVDLAQNAIDKLCDEPAPEPVSLECDHCGDTAITATLWSGDEGGPCASCAFPGQVSIDDDADEMTWLPSDDADAKCNRADCAECKPAPVIVRIALTDRRPVEVDAAEWRMIARAPMSIDAWDAATSKAAESFIAVIEHKDGRRIVFGARPLNAPGAAKSNYAGWLVPTVSPIPPARVADDKRTIECIRGVATEIGAGQLAPDCIAALPAERL